MELIVVRWQKTTCYCCCCWWWWFYYVVIVVNMRTLASVWRQNDAFAGIEDRIWCPTFSGLDCGGTPFARLDEFQQCHKLIFANTTFFNCQTLIVFIGMQLSRSSLHATNQIHPETSESKIVCLQFSRAYFLSQA